MKLTGKKFVFGSVSVMPFLGIFGLLAIAFKFMSGGVSGIPHYLALSACLVGAGALAVGFQAKGRMARIIQIVPALVCLFAIIGVVAHLFQKVPVSAPTGMFIITTMGLTGLMLRARIGSSEK